MSDEAGNTAPTYDSEGEMDAKQVPTGALSASRGGSPSTVVDRISAASRGAEFVRADLQIHTPIDRRFKLPAGFSTDTNADKERIAKRYIEVAKGAGIGIVGITEHNDLSYAPFIHDAARESGVVVFPGVEFSLPPKLHLIALFEPDADAERLWDCIVKMGFGRKAEERFHGDGTPKQAAVMLQEFLRRISGYGGIVIAPHACGQAGILTFSDGQARVEAWTEEAILAADPGMGRRVSELSEFEQNAFQNTQSIYKRRRPMPAVWTSDARSFEEIGRCHTWLKLSSPTVEGLRQAFLDPESRVRHKDVSPRLKSPRILGMGWEGAGFLKDQVIAFNDNLNCLIGGKGVGKSSVIETLRFAFGLEPPADMRELNRGHLKAILPPGAKVTVAIESQEPRQTYVVERTQGGYEPVVKDRKGNLISDITPLDLQHPSIFGQKEIYGIAREPSDQLKVLDSFLGSRISELNAEEAAIKRDLGRNATELLSLLGDVSEIADQVAELPKLQQLKKRYEQLGIPSRLATKTGFQANFERLKRVKAKLERFRGSLEALESGLGSEYDTLPDAEPLQAELVKARDLLLETQSEWDRSRGALRQAISDRLEIFDELLAAAQAKFTAVEDEFRGIADQIHKEYPEAKIDEFLRLQADIDAILPIQHEADQKKTLVERLRADRKTLLDKLLGVCRTRYDERSKQAKELTERLEGILRVQVKFEGRADVIRSSLEGLKAGVRKTSLDSLLSHHDFSFPGFLAAVDGGAEELRTRFGLTDSAASDLIKAMDGKVRYDWDCLDVPDAIEIEFNVGPASEPQFRPLDRLSVGQKSTAVLLLLLLKDDNPFIVDQPEEDLDNRFIYEDIVRRLRSAKEKRQFIVATHNANIPVLGDAEQIIVLSASSSQGTIECTGSIDDVKIKGFAKEILEGGESAFEMRREKYGF